jgi:hypothetical protein
VIVGSAWVLALVLEGAQVPVAAVPKSAAESPVVETEVTAALVADVLPNQDVVELRPRVTFALTTERSRSLTIHVDGVLEAWAGERRDRTGGVRAEVRDAWIERGWRLADLRAGYGRIAWGRLDEIAPTDVVNPIDAARFLLEGRSEARMAVPFVRGRLTPSERLSVEGVVAPIFRRGSFDRLGESTSPFNLLRDALPSNGIVPAVPGRAHRGPSVSLATMSGGGRVLVTAGRVDVAGSLYRGFEGLGAVTTEVGPFGPNGSLAVRLVEHHSRFTMVGADFETVAGEWVWRGEVAAFVDRAFAGPGTTALVDGKTLDAGIGFDRRAGDFRVFGSVVVHRDWSVAAPAVERTDVNLVGSIERSFGRERYLGRVFAVVNPVDAAIFARAMFAWKLTDVLGLELSSGSFLGSSDDTIGRFHERDFVMAKLQAWF